MVSFKYSQLLANHKEPLIAYMYGPMIVMIMANVVMFVWATFNFYQRSVESSKVTNISRKNQRYYSLQQLHSKFQSNPIRDKHQLQV